MDQVPDPDERRWLLACTASLVSTRGHRAWVASHIVEPTRSYLPDDYPPTPQGVERLARRLLRYAGLPQVRPLVAREEMLRDAGRLEGRACEQAEPLAARFEGLSDGRAVLAVDPARLDDPDVVLGAVAHAVAHAYRARHGLDAPDDTSASYRDAPRATADVLEERRAGVTAVYLGLGVLATNAAHLHRSTGELQGTMASLRVVRHAVGALSPQASAFVLAAQAVTRGLDTRAIDRIERHLVPNQAAFFRASRALLAESSAGALAREIGLPAREHWPAPRKLAALTRPFRDTEHDAPDDALAKPGPSAPVFRVVRTHANALATMLGLGGAMFAGVASAGSLAIALPVGAATATLGYLLGRGLRRDECSNPQCGGHIELGATTCARCGGRVMGEIRDPRDRLAALERIERGRDDGDDRDGLDP